MAKNISILICTRNRAKRIKNLFESLYSLQIPLGISYEILIVNNGSTDDTEIIIKKCMNHFNLPVTYLEMKEKGKSKALNYGIKYAQGALLLFADDDVVFSSSWLQAYWYAYKNFSEYDGFGGRVIPKWEGQFPDWMKGGMLDFMPLPLLNMVDFGTKLIPFPNRGVPGGLNSGLRRSVINKIGLFNEKFGPGTNIPYAEDTEYFRRIINNGGKFLYVPEAKVEHINSPERMTQQYALKWNFEVSRSQAMVFGSLRKYKRVANIPIYLMRELIQRLILWLFDCNKKTRFAKKMGVMRTIGHIKGHIDHMWSIKT